METIVLPGFFPGPLNLVELNQKLKAKLVQLDWSQVIDLAYSDLDLLLEGIDVVEDSDLIGQNTASNQVCARIIEWSRQNQPKIDSNLAHNPQSLNPEPRIWQSEPDQYQLRARLEEKILQDLLGPAGGETEELAEDRVSDRYLVGMLAPKKRQLAKEEASEEQDSLEIGGEEGSQDGSSEVTAPPNNTMFPSSLGFTFCVTASATELVIEASWGNYTREASEVTFNDQGEPRRVWKRTPIGGKRIVPLTQEGPIHWVVDPDQAPEVYVQGKIRRIPESKDWIITLFLINNQTEPKQTRDTAWLFQAQLRATCSDPQVAIFRRQPFSQSNPSPEQKSISMLYRHQVEFAVGHGVSVTAEISPQDPQQALSLTTSIIPRFEVPRTEPPTPDEIPLLRDLVLDMKKLINFSPEQLQPLVTAYQDWITTQEQKLLDPQTKLTDYQSSARQTLEQCQKTLTRIQQGINTLAQNPQAAEAFVFMNQVMWQQRIRSLYAEKKRRGEEVTLESQDTSKNRSWRPFQLAFILLNLPSLTDIHHPERSNPEQAIADLLWFPTGGGKTEAYLGVAAYTMAIRRLQGIVGDRDSGGVTILMRYTLRLLTLQQFQRATTLICAAESVRRQDQNRWGTEPFRIGLWVGGDSTPNRTSDSEEWVKSIKGQNSRGKRGSPHQLNNCPWCGTDLDPGRQIEVKSFERGEGRTLVKCSNYAEDCLFSQGEGLPIVVVDEEIYRRLPTLLIATVDKFAQMPWKGAVQMLFGEVNGYCERHGFRSPDLEDSDSHPSQRHLAAARTIRHLKLRPPDLIIQDELHLISGPLGSLVGLYETAVDSLSSWQVDGKIVMPKIIASTATIKQAQAQVKQLFARELQVFPPQGLDIEDNFFSRQRKPSRDTPGRVYLGICAQGRRVKAAMIRVYIAAMAAAQSLYDEYDGLVDPWMTLVGYFNSLRELGGTRRLVDDDITIRLGKMQERGLSNRHIQSIEELTSRKSSTDIPRILDQLETPFTAEHKSKKKSSTQKQKPRPLDVVLATNMISVGVDVKRLGLMVVCGQPKNTAEYIQATSRVGRSSPGLVITVYNWARPRDLSHYERFEHYHATFYQHVEALSVTPFSLGSLERGLTAVLVALIRLQGEELNENKTAGKIDLDHPYVTKAVETITNRVEQIQGKKQAMAVRQDLYRRLESWCKEAQKTDGGRTLTYKKTTGDTMVKLLHPASGSPWEQFTCLNALRNVEQSINLVFSDQPPDDDDHRPPTPFSS